MTFKAERVVLGRPALAILVIGKAFCQHWWVVDFSYCDGVPVARVDVPLHFYR
ncbi:MULTISPECIES: hypothetical protein [Pseudomonas]|uniref:hypothetical protein n=1 Tax=Pseudomonas TaxID=286 RepID=UPI001428B34B|nr:MULTISPECIES: hypothetical protein [Pseudomonas]